MSAESKSTVKERLRASCERCLDTSVTFDSRGPTLCVHDDDRQLSPAARRFSERVWLLMEKQKELDRIVVNVGRLLTHGDASTPVSGLMLREWMGLNERQVKASVETLRADWLLPVISRRAQPSGYWLAGSAEEYLSWWRTHRAQAITELTTGYHNLRANYPELAGQGSLDFVNGVTQELQEALR